METKLKFGAQICSNHDQLSDIRCKLRHGGGRRLCLTCLSNAGRCYSRLMSDPARRTRQGTGRVEREAAGAQWKRWALGVAVVLLAIIAIQNSQKVEIKLLFIEGQTPLIVGLLIAGLLGAVIGYVAPLVRRGRHEEQRHYKD